MTAARSVARLPHDDRVSAVVLSDRTARRELWPRDTEDHRPEHGTAAPGGDPPPGTGAER